MQAIHFMIDGQHFAVPASNAVEVLQAAAITPLPGAPVTCEGVLDVRGALVPVMDARRRFGLHPRPLTPDQHFLLVSTGGLTVGLRVDEVTNLERLVQERIESPARVLRGTEEVAGVGRTRDGLVVIFDLHAFLSQDEALQLRRSLEATRG